MRTGSFFTSDPNS